MQVLNKASAMLDKLALIFILALGLTLYLSYYEGLTAYDEVLYTNNAWKLIQGDYSLNLWDGTRRLTHIIPFSVIFYFFGVNQYSVLVWPIAASLLTGVLISKIGELTICREVGLIAAFMWVVQPLNILHAPTAYPDNAMALFATGAIYFYLIGKSQRPKKSLAYFLAGLCLIYGFWTKELIIFVGIFLFVWELSIRLLPVAKAGTKRFQAVSLLVLGLAIFGYYGSLQTFSFPDALGTTASDLYFTAFGGPATIVFSLIFLASIAASLVFDWHQGYFFVAWFLITAVLYEWFPVNFDLLTYTPNNSNTVARNIIFLLPPLTLLVGLVLSKVIPTIVKPKLLAISSILLASIIALNQLGLIHHNVLLFTSLLMLPASTLTFLFLIFRNKRQPLANPTILLFFFTIALGLAAISPVAYINGTAYGDIVNIRNVRQASLYILKLPGEYDIYFLDNADTRLLSVFNFYSGYTFGPNVDETLSGRIHISGSIDVPQNAYIIDVYGSQAAKPGWQIIKVFQQSPSIFVPHPSPLILYQNLGSN